MSRQQLSHTEPTNPYAAPAAELGHRLLARPYRPWGWLVRNHRLQRLWVRQQRVRSSVHYLLCAVGSVSAFYVLLLWLAEFLLKPGFLEDGESWRWLLFWGLIGLYSLLNIAVCLLYNEFELRRFLRRHILEGTTTRCLECGQPFRPPYAGECSQCGLPVPLAEEELRA